MPVFVGVVAPAERRLRWWRWLLVGAAAHVVGTYAGQLYLSLVGNVALRPTFTEVGYLTAFAVGLAAVPLAPGRDQAPYPPGLTPLRA